MNKPTQQTRKVKVLGEDVVVHHLQHREWVVHTPVGMVCFRSHRQHGSASRVSWTPYFGDCELNEWATTKLDTSVQRVMLRAKVAVAVASAFRVLGGN